MLHSISCLCAKFTQQVELEPTDKILNLCHCTACRTVSGQICTSYYLLQTDPPLGSLEKYEQSDTFNRYFCGNCGSHVFAHDKHTGRFSVASGLIDGPPQSESIRHWAIGDTHDGGLSSFLPGDALDSDVCWLQPNDRDIDRIKIERASHNPCRLTVRCHCGGIKVYITRPDSASTEPWSPWPDLVVPYNSGTSAENKDDVKWWLCAEKTKYMAGTCACRSCRLASGFPIQTWAFVPKSNITTAQGLELTFNAGTTKRYESSPHVYREFCSRCGASVFWHCEKRPLLIDVSVGLLEAESGSRAEEWLEWFTERTSFAEMAVDKSLINHLEIGLKTWAANNIN
ncbi:Mss4-like protein [Aspergillus unguis]